MLGIVGFLKAIITTAVVALGLYHAPPVIPPVISAIMPPLGMMPPGSLPTFNMNTPQKTETQQPEAEGERPDDKDERKKKEEEKEKKDDGDGDDSREQEERDEMEEKEKQKKKKAAGGATELPEVKKGEAQQAREAEQKQRELEAVQVEKDKAADAYANNMKNMKHAQKTDPTKNFPQTGQFGKRRRSMLRSLRLGLGLD